MDKIKMAKSQLFYILSLLTEDATSSIEYDKKHNEYYIHPRVGFVFTKEQFEALKEYKEIAIKF